MQPRIVALGLALTLTLGSITPVAAEGPPAPTATRIAGIACLLAAAGVPLAGNAIVSDVDHDGLAVLTLGGGVTVTVAYLDLNGDHVFTCGEPITSVTIKPPA